MWVRTEQGGVNLNYAVEVRIEKEADDAAAYVVCAHMTVGTHIPIAVRADYGEAKTICDQIVERLTGDQTPVG